MDSDTSRHGGFVFYHYQPSLAGSAFFASVFFLSTILHAWQIIRTKTWFFIPMFVGTLMEGIGYVGRCLSSSEPLELGPFILQSTLLLISPALFAASIYIILGRLIVHLGAQKHSLVRVDWLTRTFVTVDVFSFLMQGSGAGIMAQGAESMNTGQKIILAGLIVQIIGFGVFMVVTVVFHLRINKTVASTFTRVSQYEPDSDRERPGPGVLSLGPRGVSWRTMLWALYAASAMIMVRSVFRVVEYAQGNDGYLLRSEVWLFVFDGVLMFITVALFHPYHPSKVLGSTNTGTGNVREEDGFPLDSVAARSNSPEGNYSRYYR
ncbi:hypothetical protein E1B28_000261 [Marasmius oreades]|uniref:RTA1-like protein n=1 Tax=Marasmius oreades TaxID=181124 RepID=A0A9P7V109_9AGAR|nr:uncharacterized protein E1B28_000261 [Marasmius oreades]KAG7098299.1 hypothetical protein E1B28_000261 [Marasmius oreades]